VIKDKFTGSHQEGALTIHIKVFGDDVSVAFTTKTRKHLNGVKNLSAWVLSCVLGIVTLK
jgi:hypothetical protein